MDCEDKIIERKDGMWVVAFKCAICGTVQGPKRMVDNNGTLLCIKCNDIYESLADDMIESKALGMLKALATRIKERP